MELSLSSFLMRMVIRDSLSDTQITKLINTCGIVYPGSRTKSVPMERLIDDLVEDFQNNIESRKIILRTLGKVNAKIIAEFKGYSLREIAESAKNPGRWVNEKKLGSVVFALSTDNRSKVRQIADRVIHFIEEQASLVWDELEEETEAILERSYIEGIEDRANKLENENKKLIQNEKKHKKQIETLKVKTEGRKLQLDSVRKELSKKSEDLKKLQKEMNIVLKEKEKIESKLKKFEDISNETTILSTTNQLIRETRKLHHKIEKVLDNILHNGNESESSYLIALSNGIEQIRRSYNNDKLVRNDKIHSLNQSIQDIAKKVEFLYSLKRGALVEKEKRIKKSKGPPRVGIFVDVQNLYYAAKRLGAKIDFEKLLSVTVGQRRLVRAIAYVILTPEIDQSGFISMLQQKSYEVKRKDLRIRSDGSAKGDWDMGMAVDIMELADKLDVVILVSGDGDFVSLVRLVKTKGPKVEVFSIIQNTSKDLIEAADQYVPISEEMLLK